MSSNSSIKVSRSIESISKLQAKKRKATPITSTAVNKLSNGNDTLTKNSNDLNAKEVKKLKLAAQREKAHQFALENNLISTTSSSPKSLSSSNSKSVVSSKDIVSNTTPRNSHSKVFSHPLLNNVVSSNSQSKVTPTYLTNTTLGLPSEPTRNESISSGPFSVASDNTNVTVISSNYSNPFIATSPRSAIRRNSTGTSTSNNTHAFSSIEVSMSSSSAILPPASSLSYPPEVFTNNTLEDVMTPSDEVYDSNKKTHFFLLSFLVLGGSALGWLIYSQNERQILQLLSMTLSTFSTVSKVVFVILMSIIVYWTQCYLKRTLPEIKAVVLDKFSTFMEYVLDPAMYITALVMLPIALYIFNYQLFVVLIEWLWKYKFILMAFSTSLQVAYMTRKYLQFQRQVHENTISYLVLLVTRVLATDHKGSIYPVDRLQEDIYEIIAIKGWSKYLEVDSSVGNVEPDDDRYAFVSTGVSSPFIGTPKTPVVSHLIQEFDSILGNISKRKLFELWSEVEEHVKRDKRIQALVADCNGIRKKTWRFVPS